MPAYNEYTTLGGQVQSRLPVIFCSEKVEVKVTLIVIAIKIFVIANYPKILAK